MKAAYVWLASAVMGAVGVIIGLVGADIITAQPLRRDIADLRAEMVAKDEATADAAQRAAAFEEETEQLASAKEDLLIEVAARDTRIAEPEEQIAAKDASAAEVDVAALQQELSELQTLYAALLEERETERGKAVETPRREEPAESKDPATENKTLAVPVPGKEGFFTSPFAPKEGFIDLRGFKSGTEVKDPYTGRIIFVP